MKGNKKHLRDVDPMHYELSQILAKGSSIQSDQMEGFCAIWAIFNVCWALFLLNIIYCLAVIWAKYLYSGGTFRKSLLSH